MLYNFSQSIDIVRQELGFQILDETTQPPLSLIKNYYNAAIKETISSFNFAHLVSQKSFPFTHNVEDVQGVTLSGLSAFPSTGINISGDIFPYPLDVMSVGATAYVNTTGISFVGTDFSGNSYSGTSTGGYVSYGTINNVMGFNYELTDDVEQIYSISIPKLARNVGFIPINDLNKMYPIGYYTISGTPFNYTYMPELGVHNNLQIQFFPTPNSQCSGLNYTVIYKKKHSDCVLDTDYQKVIPEQFQDIITYATLEKSYMFLGDADAVQRYMTLKQKRMSDMRRWSENNIGYMFSFQDANYINGNGALNAYVSSPFVRI
jgi:hypothetical protein